MSIRQTIENISSRISDDSNFDDISEPESKHSEEKNELPQLSRRTRGISQYSLRSDQKSDRHEDDNNSLGSSTEKK